MSIFTNYLGKPMSSPFMKFFFNFCSENAYTKLITLYKRSNHTDVIFHLVSKILLHERYLKQACNLTSYLILKIH